MNVSTEAYFDVLGVDKATIFQETAFVAEEEGCDAIEFDRTVIDPVVPELVVPADYRNCIGLITYIFDIFIAFIFRCLSICSREQQDPSELPAAAFELTEKSVVLMEARTRSLKQSEKGQEHLVLVDQITTCVQEIDSTYSQKDVEKIALKVASAWRKFSEHSLTIGSSTLFKESLKMTTSSIETYDLEGSKRSGYLRPPVLVKRVDEIRNGKLHQSNLMVMLPIIEGGVNQEVALYSGIVHGADAATNREKKREVTLKEGQLLQLGNPKDVLESHILIGTGSGELTRELLTALEFIGDNLMPQSNEVTLHKLTGGVEGFSLHANDLMFCRLNTFEDPHKNESAILEKLDELNTKLFKESAYIVEYGLTRPDQENKWQVEISFVKAEK